MDTPGGVVSRRSRAGTTVDPGISALLARAATLRGDRRRSVPRAAADWYKIRNADGASGDTAEVWLYTEIDDWWGISAEYFVAELRNITASTIKLRVNCKGGDVFDGLAIYQALLSHPARVEVQIDGIAASAASYIVQAGDHVTIGPAAMVMIHDALCGCVGNASDLRGCADLLDKISDAIADLYALHAGGTSDEWRERMLADGGNGTWYTGAEAVDVGLVDEVLDQGRKRRCDDEDGEGEGDEPPLDRAPTRQLAATITPADVAAALHEVLDQRSAADAPAPPVDLQAGDADTSAEPDPEPAASDQGATEPDPQDETWDALTSALINDDPWASLTRGLL